MLNLFARISPSPAVLRRLADPVGAEADSWIRRRLAAQPEATLWLGWGNQGTWRRRDQEVLALVQGRGLWALGLTAAGQPRHPLYVASDVALQSLTWHNQQTLGHPVGTSVSLPGAPPCPASPAAMPCICI